MGGATASILECGHGMIRLPILFEEKRSRPARRSRAFFGMAWISGSAISLILSISLALKFRPASGSGSPDGTAAELPREEAYFQFDYPPYPQTFIFKLTDGQKIQEAREILSGTQPNRHVMGTIIKQPAAYNSPWSYSLDPPSVTFFDYASEVCDASIQYVQDHLNEACSAFLPNCAWCPWGSRLLAEVNPQPTVTPPALNPLLFFPFITR